MSNAKQYWFALTLYGVGMRYAVIAIDAQRIKAWKAAETFIKQHA